MPYIRVLEVATFYTMFQLQPVGKKAHVQVCGTTPCRLRGAGDLIEVCQSRIHHDPFHLSKDGNFSWEEVECLGACVNAPMVLIWKDTYEDLTKESFGKVLDGFASGNPPEARSADRPPVLRAGRWADHAEGNHMKRDRNSKRTGRGVRCHEATDATSLCMRWRPRLFIFLLQRYALNASLDSSLLWALTFGGCAAGLAYSQSNR